MEFLLKFEGVEDINLPALNIDGSFLILTPIPGNHDGNHPGGAVSLRQEIPQINQVPAAARADGRFDATINRYRRRGYSLNDY
jgi:hypothetical protein